MILAILCFTGFSRIAPSAVRLVTHVLPRRASWPVLLIPDPSAPASLGRIALTDRTVRALKPPSTGRLDVWDEDNPGFGLRISAEGRRTWILMYRMGKTLRRLTLGRFPTLGLAAAREKATDALREVAKGQDPGRQKIEERRAETFSDLAREYIERHASKKRSGREDVRLLNGSPHKKKTGKKPHVPLVTRWGRPTDQGHQATGRPRAAGRGRRPCADHGEPHAGARAQDVQLRDRARLAGGESVPHGQAAR